MVLCAGVLATLAACHQAKPVASVGASPSEIEQPSARRATLPDRSAREVTGYAAPAAPPTYELAPRAAATPAPAPASPDDPMREFDMP